MADIVVSPINGNYLAFGTCYRDDTNRKNVIAVPWKIFKVSGQEYFRVIAANMNKDFAVMQKLTANSNEYGRIDKWVNQRGILQDSKASCKIDGRKLVELLEENFLYRETN